MLTEQVTLSDGSSLARSVRAIASQAQRALKRPAHPGESRDLLDAIDALERAATARSWADLARWLASLRDRVESHDRAAH